MNTLARSLLAGLGAAIGLYLTLWLLLFPLIGVEVSHAYLAGISLVVGTITWATHRSPAKKSRSA